MRLLIPYIKRYSGYKMRRINYIIIIFAAGCIVKCSYQPLQFDEGAIPFENINQAIEQSVVYLDSTMVCWTEGNRGTSNYVLLGEYNGQNCSIALKYTSLPDSSTILSAILSMEAVYIYGSGTPVSATAHTITDSWSETTQSDISYDIIPLTIFTLSPLVADSDVVALPPSIVQSWVTALHDSLSKNNGVLLQVNSAPFAKQYGTKSSGINLIVRYQKDGNQYISVIKPSEDTYIVSGSKSTSQKVVVTNYGSHRTLLKFNLSAVPLRIVVNNAELVLRLDSNHSNIGNESEYKIMFSRITSATWDTPTLTTASFDSTTASITAVTGNPELRFDVTQIVQNWFADKGHNYGALLKSGQEQLDLSQFSFFYDLTDSLKQPHIIIRYSVFNKN